MKNKSILVHCSYSDTGPALEELVRESFRVYLKKELPPYGQTQKPDETERGPDLGENVCFRK